MFSKLKKYKEDLKKIERREEIEQILKIREERPSTTPLGLEAFTSDESTATDEKKVCSQDIYEEARADFD